MQNESETMFYNYSKDQPALRSNNFYITKPDENNILEKYVLKRAVAVGEVGHLGSVAGQLRRLDGVHDGGFEARKQVQGHQGGDVEKDGRVVRVASSYQLENLYSQTMNYFSIYKRTRVMNEKLNHCVELADLITSNLNDIHHMRLEKIIIYLIMIEVCFEFIHYAERYYGS